ncbi:activating signal cointegrator 1 complex subunit 2 isoform X1 [Macrobrachium rosenbergii]|uniref:activating signal cointegrator 1 complex subunit 2 isoform X1 n=2 Tax=Macrobrachium rosenbergii TaxID=79674 RepID=UPI0034D68D63
MSGAIPKGSVRPKQAVEPLLGSPIDKKIITVNDKGVERKVPALHIGWAEKRTLVRYVPPPVDEDGMFPPGAQEMWLELLEYVEQDLNYLLRLPHHRFWSKVVYDPGVHTCLDSYLVNARRSLHGSLDNAGISTREFSATFEESIHRHVMLVFIRMATYKESRENHITPSVFGDIIYENFIFDICKIFDICVLYGHTNQAMISKMVGNIFTCQAKYYTDLAETIPTVTLAFDNIEDKLGVAENMLPVALSSSNRQLSIEDVHNIVLFLSDTLMSIKMFLMCHSPACKYFHEASFEIRLCACYERTIPMMMEILNEQADEPELQLWITKLIEKIEITRLFALKIFRLIVQHICFEPLLGDTAGPSLVGECVEKFMHMMSTCIGDKTFIADYCSVYPIKEDLEFFKQHDGDVTSLDFITDAVSTVMCEMGLSSEMKSLSLKDSSPVNEEVTDTSGMNGYVENKTVIPSDIELSSLVSHVQDLLPDLGEGFIQQCLQYYEYSTEAVINAILEDSLPPSLVTLDRSAPALKKPVPVVPPETSENEVKQEKKDFMDRANIYNNDEFDVFSRRDVDHSRIHKGKKSHEFNYNEDDTKMLKDIARKYEERGGTSIYEDEFRLDEDAHRGWEYEDEYDDTYDDNEMGNCDVMPEVPKKRAGIFGAGRLNERIDLFESGSNSSDEEGVPVEEKTEEIHEKDKGQQSSVNRTGARPKNLGNKRGVQRIFTNSSSKSSKPKQATPTPEREPEEKPSNHLQFCENPEEVRVRAEQRRQDREPHRYRRGRETHWQENGPSNDQYVPKPKVSAASSRSSGKSWRQGQSGDDEDRGYHGGKYKEDTNHGKAQSHFYRNKMVHKNVYKRQGAQAKFNRNN